MTLLLAACMLFTGCGEKTTGLKNFSTSGNCYICAYESDKTEFDINNVTLEFSYGMYFFGSVEWELEHCSQRFAYHDIYIESCQKNGDKTLIKRAEEDFISEKYRVTKVYDENNNFVRWDFNCSEMITIPKEVFSKDKDHLVFRIYGEALVDDGIPSYRLLSSEVGIAYKVKGDKVILAVNFGEEWEKYENYYNIPGN